jgi:hypothetical protein
VKRVVEKSDRIPNCSTLPVAGPESVLRFQNRTKHRQFPASPVTEHALSISPRLHNFDALFCHKRIKPCWK